VLLCVSASVRSTPRSGRHDSPVRLGRTGPLLLVEPRRVSGLRERARSAAFAAISPLL
jgi:hypothetical protein